VSAVLEVAIAWARLGVGVVPVHDSAPGKLDPEIRWKEDGPLFGEDQVREYWAAHPDAQLAITLDNSPWGGPRLVCVDDDSGKHDPGQQERPRPFGGYRESTRGGGFHNVAEYRVPLPPDFPARVTQIGDPAFADVLAGGLLFIAPTVNRGRGAYSAVVPLEAGFPVFESVGLALDAVSGWLREAWTRKAREGGRGTGRAAQGDFSECYRVAVRAVAAGATDEQVRAAVNCPHPEWSPGRIHRTVERIRRWLNAHPRTSAEDWRRTAFDWFYESEDLGGFLIARCPAVSVDSIACRAPVYRAVLDEQGNPTGASNQPVFIPIGSPDRMSEAGERWRTRRSLAASAGAWIEAASYVYIHEIEWSSGRRPKTAGEAKALGVSASIMLDAARKTWRSISAGLNAQSDSAIYRIMFGRDGARLVVVTTVPPNVYMSNAGRRKIAGAKHATTVPWYGSTRGHLDRVLRAIEACRPESPPWLGEELSRTGELSRRRLVSPWGCARKPENRVILSGEGEHRVHYCHMGRFHRGGDPVVEGPARGGVPLTFAGGREAAGTAREALTNAWWAYLDEARGRFGDGVSEVVTDLPVDARDAWVQLMSGPPPGRLRARWRAATA
jgi:hypothetical protein